MNDLMTLEQVKELISSGKKLFLAGDENLLSQLPKGDWIAGTIPYFMASEGGCITDKKIFVNDVSSYVKSLKVKSYTASNISDIPKDVFGNGFAYVIIPGFSDCLGEFALKAQTMEGIYDHPIAGWVSGINLDDLGKVTPKVFNGTTGEKAENEAVVMFVEMPDEKIATVEVINIFTPGEGDEIQFKEDGFECSTCLINGKEVNLVDYIEANNIDIRFPIVADYAGAMINISFQEVDKENKKVRFYAPLRKDVVYHHAKPVDNYVAEFDKIVQNVEGSVVGTCNCILNFLYSELEGKKTGKLTGPITFGEISYVLVNQTMVYLNVFEK